MEANFSSGGGVADTYSRSEIPLYLGSNAVLYVGAGSPTPGGTHTGGATHHTPDSVPEVWREKWGAWGTIDNRQEVATGFANLVAKHSLTIDLRGGATHRAGPCLTSSVVAIVTKLWALPQDART
jgi:hypothetical protein